MITVAVLDEPTEANIKIKESDLEYKTCRSGGNGGQAINTTSSAVHLTHLPTGIHVRCESDRSQLRNKETALALLRLRLHQEMQSELDNKYGAERKKQVGTGIRNDKRRTVNYPRDSVVDHITGKSIDAKSYFRGNIEKLWK